jgi:hypothetical protein
MARWLHLSHKDLEDEPTLKKQPSVRSIGITGTQPGGVEMSEVQLERNEALTTPREAVPFAGQRIVYSSRLNFDQVMSNLRAHVGETAVANIVELSAASESVETFEKKVQQYVGDRGFMLLAEIDHGRWIEKFGIKVPVWPHPARCLAEQKKKNKTTSNCCWYQGGAIAKSPVVQTCGALKL